MESITVSELIELLSAFEGGTTVTAMFRCNEEVIIGVHGDNEDGVYLDVGQ